ncbi:tyrosine-type recombinase/integrase [Mangrovicoccus sp. HB161399]|uniref:site-specific integrase n=1 Tax=Mangrovicoccus sp. HB161399 TaxID=2720392 RepID=UPI00155303A0|nr:tyrosine-type recombinase/integrase [Mangrovicoccus sp. HB161399]
MATFIKTDFGWQAQVARRVDGKSVRKAKTFKTKRDAQIWAREFEVEISKETAATSQDTMAQVFDRYGRERSSKKKGERWEIIRLERFKTDPANGKPLGEHLIGEIAGADIAAWRDRRLNEVKPASVRREMNLLKHVFTCAINDWELIQVSPMAKVTRPAGSKRRKRRVLPDEIEKISAALDLEMEPWVSEKQITGAAFLFAIETAMRSGEILAIRNRDVSGMVVHVPETKNDHERYVPMTARAAEILAKVRNGNAESDARPFDIDAVSRDSRFRAAAAKAGIVDLHFHDTRHEGITRLAKRLQILDLARMTGHKDVNELLTYYEASGAELAELLNASTSRDEIR